MARVLDLSDADEILKEIAMMAQKAIRLRVGDRPVTISIEVDGMRAPSMTIATYHGMDIDVPAQVYDHVMEMLYRRIG